MSIYPMPYEIKSGRCLAPCPNREKGFTGAVVMLGSVFCRSECRYSADRNAEGGEPVKCNFIEMTA